MIVLGLAPGLLGLAFEAYVGHYVGSTKSGGSALQPVPIWFGTVGFVVLMAICALGQQRFRIGVRVFGAISFVVGAVGVVMHVWAFVEELLKEHVFDEQGEAFMEALDTALGSAPPAFAPGAFALMGLLLYALGSGRVLIRIKWPQALK